MYNPIHFFPSEIQISNFLYNSLGITFVSIEAVILHSSNSCIVIERCCFVLQGLRPSQIGVILRDSHGVAQVRRVTGNKIVRILKAKVRTLISAFLIE